MEKKKHIFDETIEEVNQFIKDELGNNTTKKEIYEKLLEEYENPALIAKTISYFPDKDLSIKYNKVHLVLMFFLLLFLGWRVLIMVLNFLYNDGSVVGNASWLSQTLIIALVTFFIEQVRRKNALFYKLLFFFSFFFILIQPPGLFSSRV